MVNKSARKNSNRYNLKSKNKSSRLRLSVHRSAKNIYVQLIDDVKGVTIVSSSSVNDDIRKGSKGLSKTKIASLVGEDVGRKILEKNISGIYFDRGAYLFHGRVKALADSVRSLGVTF